MNYDDNTIYYEDTLMTYVRTRKEITFQEDPFNEVDALLLCQMVYPQVEWFVPKLRKGSHEVYDWKNPGRIHTIGWKHLDVPGYRKILFDSFYGSMYRQLFDEIKDSARYGKIRLGCMRAMTDQERVVQFAALTAYLDEETALVIYRGTDSSLTGWREDFKYSYMRKWPAHTLAREYLLDVARLLPKNIYVAGHSKGGNLAVYAAALVPEHVQRRIKEVCSFDGMGFRSGFYQTEGYQRIRDRVFKLVPSESLIGMLFVPEKGFKIVASYEHGFLQHDLMNWKIKDGKFLLNEGFTKKQNRLINRMNRWILSLSGRERKGFVNILFDTLGDLLMSEGAQTMTESGSVFKTIRKKLAVMTKRERKLFLRSLRRFALPKKPPHVYRKRRKKNDKT